jgi:hypothetical protein
VIYKINKDDKPTESDKGLSVEKKGSDVAIKWKIKIRNRGVKTAGDYIVLGLI